MTPQYGIGNTGDIGSTGNSLSDQEQQLSLKQLGIFNQLLLKGMILVVKGMTLIMKRDVALRERDEAHHERELAIADRGVAYTLYFQSVCI
jgi:hypothetical protein